MSFDLSCENRKIMKAIIIETKSKADEDPGSNWREKREIKPKLYQRKKLKIWGWP